MKPIRPRSHDAGTKLRHKMNTVCNCSHDASSMSVSSLFFFSNRRNETVTVTYSHNADSETEEFRYGFKLLRLALWFHIF